MLLGPLIHPTLLGALARAGHGSKVLLADANFPHGTGAAAGAERIYLNLAPGMLDVDQVLRVLLSAIPVEAGEVMLPPDGVDVPAIAGYRAALEGIPVAGHDRQSFYEAARHPDVAVVIATGDARVYANLLLTIGVRTPSD
jgi:L-fucose mutarotase